MAENSPRFHVVKGPEGGGLKRPGPAIIWVIVYAGLFAAGLVYFRARSPMFRRSAPPSAPARPAVSSRSLVSDSRDAAGAHAPQAPARDELLEGAGLPVAARTRYFEKLATERCNCGCERSLADCLVNEKSCSRSPVLAQDVWRQSRK
jgi:hypothetical protein